MATSLPPVETISNEGDDELEATIHSLISSKATAAADDLVSTFQSLCVDNENCSLKVEDVCDLYAKILSNHLKRLTSYTPGQCKICKDAKLCDLCKIAETPGIYDSDIDECKLENENYSKCDIIHPIKQSTNTNDNCNGENSIIDVKGEIVSKYKGTNNNVCLPTIHQKQLECEKGYENSNSIINNGTSVSGKSDSGVKSKSSTTADATPNHSTNQLQYKDVKRKNECSSSELSCESKTSKIERNDSSEDADPNSSSSINHDSEDSEDVLEREKHLGHEENKIEDHQQGATGNNLKSENTYSDVINASHVHLPDNDEDFSLHVEKVDITDNQFQEKPTGSNKDDALEVDLGANYEYCGIKKTLRVELPPESTRNQGTMSTTPRSASADNIAEAAANESKNSTQRVFPRPFFRKLSFKGLRKNKFFNKPRNEESPFSNQSDLVSDDRHAVKTMKVVVEFIKEGPVQLLAEDSLEGQQQWIKCKLALLALPAGNVIQFYTPPKNLKAHSGVFCQSVYEVRETTDLEMPDLRNTFVIKADGVAGKEWIVQGIDNLDKREWLMCFIRHCNFHQTVFAPLISGTKSDKPLSFQTPLPLMNGLVRVQHPTVIPQGKSFSGPLFQSPLSRISSDPPLFGDSTHHTHVVGAAVGLPQPSTGGAISNPVGAPGVEQSFLRECIWFHGTMSRSKAASAVLTPNLGTVSGAFLVRQSATRMGEYVLTFNCHAKAKHLRLTINPDGSTQVQDFSFASIFDLLKYFRSHPVPGTMSPSRCVLTDYVIKIGGSDDESNGSDDEHTTAEGRRLDSSSDGSVFITHRGSLYLTKSDVNAQMFLDYPWPDEDSNGRAVANIYTYN